MNKKNTSRDQFVQNKATKRETKKQKNVNHLAIRWLTFFNVPPDMLFLNQYLVDLDKIWELRYWIPDLSNPILPPNIANKLCYLLQISARLGFLLVDTIKCSYTIRVSLSLLYTQ
jgi:hypothetical protein